MKILPSGSIVKEITQLKFVLQIKVWDAKEKKCTGILMGHTGSVKSLSPHPTNSGTCLALPSVDQNG